MQSTIIQDIHEKGHFGAGKVEAILTKDYYVQGATKKIKALVKNCVPCILSERKQGKQEGSLNTIDKGDRPLSTYHVDHVGPLSSTQKQYQYLFVVIDGFSKFVWLYPTKTTTEKEVIDRLAKQSAIFGNPNRIVSDRGAAFLSTEFGRYCNERDIKHVTITTGVPRGNGQVERVNRILIPILTKYSMDCPDEWYKHVPNVQKILNSTPQRAIGMSPFKLLTGVEMRTEVDLGLQEILNEELLEMFMENRDELRSQAKQNIRKIQEENKIVYNKKRKPAHRYKLGDMVAIKRTQFGTRLKLRIKFLGPYRIKRVRHKDRYDVERVGEGEGPRHTSASADNMKLWYQYDSSESDSSGTNESQDCRDVGCETSTV